MLQVVQLRRGEGIVEHLWRQARTAVSGVARGCTTGLWRQRSQATNATGGAYARLVGGSNIQASRDVQHLLLQTADSMDTIVNVCTCGSPRF